MHVPLMLASFQILSKLMLASLQTRNQPPEVLKNKLHLVNLVAPSEDSVQPTCMPSACRCAPPACRLHGAAPPCAHCGHGTPHLHATCMPPAPPASLGCGHGAPHTCLHADCTPPCADCGPSTVPLAPVCRCTACRPCPRGHCMPGPGHTCLPPASQLPTAHRCTPCASCGRGLPHLHAELNGRLHAAAPPGHGVPVACRLAA